MSTAPTRGARQRARTKQKLTEAARGLIAEKGVAGLRISEITERADVALGSFYNHFQSKEELVEEVVADTIEALAEAMVEPMNRLSDPAEAVSYATRMFVRLTRDNQELAWLLINLDGADAEFERFDIADTHVALTGVVGSTLAVMRAILDGRYGHRAEILHAETVLRGIGLEPADAREIANRELPALDLDSVAVGEPAYS
jgi:AcrR family transcriptional regulator